MSAVSGIAPIILLALFVLFWYSIFFYMLTSKVRRDGVFITPWDISGLKTGFVEGPAFQNMAEYTGGTRMANNPGVQRYYNATKDAVIEARDVPCGICGKQTRTGLNDQSVIIRNWSCLLLLGKPVRILRYNGVVDGFCEKHKAKGVENYREAIESENVTICNK